MKLFFTQVIIRTITRRLDLYFRFLGPLFPPRLPSFERRCVLSYCSSFPAACTAATAPHSVNTLVDPFCPIQSRAQHTATLPLAVQCVTCHLPNVTRHPSHPPTLTTFPGARCTWRVVTRTPDVWKFSLRGAPMSARGRTTGRPPGPSSKTPRTSEDQVTPTWSGHTFCSTGPTAPARGGGGGGF